jgi:hypothetical protein
MEALLLILAFAAGIGGLVCGVIILIDAFQDEIWKGLVSILCGLYLLYYALFEFDSERKWLIIAGWLGGGVISLALRIAAISMSAQTG